MKKKNFAKDVFDAATKAREEWASEWRNTEAIKHQVFRMLESHMRQIVFGFLGLEEDGFQRLRVKTNSALAHEIEGIITDRCKSEIVKLIAEQKLSLTPAEKTKLKKFFKEKFDSAMRYSIDREAVKAADTLAQEFVERELEDARVSFEAQFATEHLAAAAEEELPK